MKWMKRNGPGIWLCVALAIGIAGAAFYLRAFMPRRISPGEKLTTDSIRHYSQKAQSHGEAAAKFKRDYENQTIESNQFDHADSLTRADQRARYRADWEKRNGY